MLDVEINIFISNHVQNFWKFEDGIRCVKHFCILYCLNRKDKYYNF